MAVNVAVVASGGAIGACVRFGLAELTHQWLGRDFPYGTLAVNIVGSLAIGWLIQLLPPTGLPHWRLFLVTGLLGGFTTYSAFSIETLGLVQAGYLARAGLNVALTVVTCFLAVWVGWQLGRWLHATA